MTPGPDRLAAVYFDTADEILQWDPTQADPLTRASVPLAVRMPTTGVRMLVGFDNGPWTYWADFDKCPQGGRRGNIYNFKYWQYTDVVYYYVHRLAAIPPAVWTNAAHRNGVKMYAAITGDCDGCGGQFNTLCGDPAAAAKQLYRLAKTYGFDGWMFDVERGVRADDKLRKTMQTLRGLTDLGGPIDVGYYEAFVYEVDGHTYPFFQAGTFYQSDYTTATTPPANSYQYLDQQHAADKRFATFWAVNVYDFAHQQQGGICNGVECLDSNGMFALLAAARMPPPSTDYYQSIALYAPDWTMYGREDDSGCPNCPLPSREQFHRTDRQFWIGDAPRLRPDGTLATAAPAASNFLAARSTVVALPFVTRFNTGEGSFFAIGGRKAVTAEWNYLSTQDRLPTWLVPIDPGSASVTADVDYDDAWDGGSSLAFKGTIGPGQRVEYAIYQTGISLSLPLQFVTFRYLLRAAGSPLPYVRVIFSDNAAVSVPATAAGPGWQQAVLPLSRPAATITRLQLGFENKTAQPIPLDVAIGELAIIPPPPTAPGLIQPVNGNGMLTWQPPANTDVWYYNVFCITPSGPSLVGRTVINRYETSLTLFPPPPGATTYMIQPVTTSGAYTDL